jgi:aldose 1-epimerase
VTAVWQGHVITAPIARGTEARGGLMLADAADTSNSEALPDGGTAEAVFDAKDFGGRWTSKTNVTVSVMLSRQAIELTVVAVNTGDVPEPIGIGWHPRFAILGANPGEVRLRIPAEMRVEVRDQGKEQPTGKLIPVAGTAYDFSMPGGAKLGTKAVDESFVQLHQGLLDNGPTAELSDPASGFGLRLTALSPTIRAMRVVAPAGAGYVSIDPQYNYPDPFGREWEKEASTGMVTLEPGQSTEWKVRLELFAPGGGAP